MGCDTMPTKSSLDHGMQDREALELVLENLSMIGLQSNFFEKDIRPLNDDTNDQLQVERRRVSANITENIPVPSSEHVAEIVGKQGCKIKALRQKTNTYIKTPGRGDEPVFIITGRREDVDLAKSEILQASEHFSNIRAQRKGVAPPPIQPGQITKTIRVPYRVVGLVVGPKGQTIKQIQQKTQTYIVTPSRERDPVFEITGLPDSVEQARIEISNYIAARTGTFIDSEKKAIAPAVSMGNTWNGERNGSFSREPVMPEEINEFLEEIFSGSSNRSPLLKHENRKRNSVDILSNESGTVEPSLVQNGTSDQYVMWNHGFNGNLKSVIPINNASHVSEILQTSGTSDPSSSGSSSTYSSFSFEASPLVRSSSFPVSSSESVTSAPGLPGARKGSDSLRQTSLLASQTAASTVASSHPWGTTMINDGINESSFLPANVLPVNVSSMLMNGTENMPAGLQTGAVGTVMGDVLANGPGIMKNCIMCDCNQISAALVPCGHNLFCYDCVSSLVQSPNAFCPVCHQPADHALRILQ